MARVIAAATPPLEPSGPGALLIVALAGVLGLGGGVAVAAVRGVLDQRLRSADQAEEATGIACLGLVPMVKDVARRQSGRGAARGGLPSEIALPEITAGHPLLLHAAAASGSNFAKALRLALARLQEGKRPGEALAVGFGAARSGAGATTLAANLALLSAKVSHRTLLVDAADGEGGLTHLLGAEGSPGLGAAAPAGGGAVAERSLGGLLDFVAMPRSTSRSTALAQPGWLAGVVDRARGSYDWIFVDLPPLESSAEARILTASLDAVVVVAEWGRTEGRDVDEALRSVSAPQERGVFVVLNKSREGRKMPRR
jgi:succinoglycan biosynthesis transport protein ExoP